MRPSSPNNQRPRPRSHQPVVRAGSGTGALGPFDALRRIGENGGGCISNTHLHLAVHGGLDLVGHLGGALVPIPRLVREQGLAALQRKKDS